jgi:O-methyltransferase involved in polyketide biosynthesis
MDLVTHDHLPPDAAWAEPPLRDSASAAGLPPALALLSPAAASLVAPLAARAGGDALFPAHALADGHATRLAASLGLDATPWLADRSAVFAMLSRGRTMRAAAQRFFARHPRALGVALGAGLSHPFQWLDTGSNLWIDADLPEVNRLRQRWLPADGARRLNADLDITAPGWWQRLGLPSARHEPPLLLWAEGLVEQFNREQVQTLLWAVGEFAPPGSKLLLDCRAWPLAGRRPSRRGLRPGDAPLRFGLRHAGELTEPHKRLRIDAVHAVLEPQGLRHRALGALFRVAFGTPMWAVYELGLDA